MGRLHAIVLVTPDPERQRAFYESQLGLGVARAADGTVTFALRGASLALRPAPAGAAPEIRIALHVPSLDARVEALKTKGVAFEGGIEDAPEGRVAVLRDPDGNPVMLVEPREPAAAASWPTLSRAIVNSERFATTAHFYRESLGLRVADEHDGWVEFDTGASRLAVHDREDTEGLPLHPDQRVTFALEDDDLDAWAEELRGRGVTFAAAPMEEELGVQAEVEDADGWFVVLHGPRPEEPREEELAEEFLDDDDAPARTQMIRRPGESTGESTKKRLTAAKIARRTSERAATKSFEVPRGQEGERGGERGGPGGFGGPRPSGPGGPPRPAGPGGPRPGGFGGPRPSGPGGPPRPGGFGGPPRPAGPGGPRPGGFGGPRPGGPGGPGGPRPGGYGGPRPGGSGGPRPGGPRPGGPRPGGPGGPPRGGSGGSGGSGGDGA